MQQDETAQDNKSELALVIARGGSIAAWALKNDVARRTAFYWAKEPKGREEVEECQRHSLNRALGRLNSRSIKAVDGIIKLAEISDSDSVRLRAWRSILADQMAVAKFSTLESRMVEIEARIQRRNENANPPGYLPAR
jgi:hypothetical protein